MKLGFRALVALALVFCARAASHAVEALAWRWLSQHRQMPGAGELNELKSENPEAFAIVQALLTKQSMGLIKRKHSSGGDASFEAPFDAGLPAPLPAPLPVPVPAPSVGIATEDMGSGSPAPAELPEAEPQTPPYQPFPIHPPPPVPVMPEIITPPAPGVVAEGIPTDVMGSRPAPSDLEDLPPPTPTAPPAMPPPPPVSPPLPPSLEDPESSGEVSPLPAPAPSPVADSSLPAEPSLPVLSAAATSSSVSTGGSGGHSWLNWNPDRMIADNERMVQNVLGAVAQLTGAHVRQKPKDHQDAADSPLAAQDDLPDETPRQSSRHAANSEPMPTMQSRNTPLRKALVAATAPADAPASKDGAAPDAADLYLSSQESQQTRSEGPQTAPQSRPAEPSDDGIAGHLPGSVSWSNPYTFTASANSQDAGTKQDNSYLREVDLGIPQVQLPPKRSPDDQNPYLQGLDLTGSSAQAAPAAISASALTAMHQKQLLSSHTLLSEHFVDWDDDRQQQQRQGRQIKAVKAKKKDALSGFLAPIKGAQQKSPQASLVNKNAYLAKLGESTAVSSSGSSALASNIEEDNPYLMALDDAPAQQQQPQQPAEAQAFSDASPRSFQTQQPQDAQVHVSSRPQLSMASSKVHEKAASKAVVQKATQKKKKNAHALSGWLGGGASPQAPNVKAQRLQQAVAQRVADNRNPYLKGLDIDNGAPKVQAGQDQANPYMASLD